jgi:hypothetical protein
MVHSFSLPSLFLSALAKIIQPPFPLGGGMVLGGKIWEGFSEMIFHVGSEWGSTCSVGGTQG